MTSAALEVADAKLIALVKGENLDEQKSTCLLQRFDGFCAVASEWAEKAKAIVVTSPDQVDLMKQARAGRLFLKAKRVEIESTRKELKEQSLREGKAIDTIAKALTALIEPTESYLSDQERFVELQEEAAKKKLSDERSAVLLALGMQPGFYDLANMTELVYNGILDGRKAQIKAEEEAKAKAEQERIEKEKEAERIRQENARLKKEAEEREKLAAAERAKAEAEKRKIQKEAEKVRREAEEKERQWRTQEAQKKAEEDKIRKEQEAAERKAKRAPDKQKLITLASNIESFQLPEMKTEEGMMVLGRVQSLLKDLTKFIRDKSDAM